MMCIVHIVEHRCGIPPPRYPVPQRHIPVNAQRITANKRTKEKNHERGNNVERLPPLAVGVNGSEWGEMNDAGAASPLLR